MVQRFTTIGGRRGIPQSTQNVPISLLSHTVAGDTTLRELYNNNFRGIGDGSINCTVRKYDDTKGREFWGIVEYVEGVFYISNDPNDVDLQAPDVVLKSEDDVPDVDSNGTFYRYYTLPDAEPSGVYITLLNNKWERTAFETDIILVDPNNLVLVSLWGLTPDDSSESFQREIDLLSYFSETLAAGSNYASLSEDIIQALLAGQNPSSDNEFVTKTELDKATTVVTEGTFPLSAFFVEVNSSLAEYIGPNIYFVINNKNSDGAFANLSAELTAIAANYGSLIRKNVDGTLTRSEPTIGRKIDMVKIDKADNAATGTLTYDYRWDGVDWVDSSHNLGNVLSITKGNGRINLNLRNGEERTLDTETYQPTGTYVGRTEDITGATGTITSAGILYGEDIKYKDNLYSPETDISLNLYKTTIDPFGATSREREYKFSIVDNDLNIVQVGALAIPLSSSPSTMTWQTAVTHKRTDIFGFVKPPLPALSPIIGTQAVVVDYGDIPESYFHKLDYAGMSGSEFESFGTNRIVPWTGRTNIFNFRFPTFTYVNHEDGNIRRSDSFRGFIKRWARTC